MLWHNAFELLQISWWAKIVARNHGKGFCSCEIVALRKNFIDRRESYDLNRAIGYAFRVHKNLRTVPHLFPHFLKERQFKKKFSTNLISLLTSTLISFENSNCWNWISLNFRSWSRRFKVFLRLLKYLSSLTNVQRNFKCRSFGQIVWENGEINAELPARFHSP
jgi:hypothetical protein